MSLIVRLNYFYKDSTNNKKFASKLFSNPFRLSLDKIDKCLKERLICEKFFYPEQVGVRKFKFHRYNKRDYSWYEYESIEPFEGENIDMNDLIEKLDASINGFLLDLSHMYY